MANTKNLRYGGTGDDVVSLQKALIAEGYDVGKTGADGVFGKNTAAAVKAYQEKNGLAVDGIAGKNTLGLLYGNSGSSSSSSSSKTTTAKTSSGTSTTTTAQPTNAVGDPNKTAVATNAVGDPNKEATVTNYTNAGTFTYDPFTYDPYSKSDIVLQAEEALRQHQTQKPGEYTPVWLDEANEYLYQYQNRDPFSYDVNKDALYQQYRDNYIQQGQMAMMDAMGQAASMTGGYGSSYSQAVGQQAYNQQLNQLNDIVPELYGMAYDRYEQEGQDLMNMYGIYMDKENQEYSRYQDGVNNWYTQLGYLTDQYNTEAERDYNQWEAGKTTAFNEYMSDKEIAYGEHTAQQDREWEKYLMDEETKREQEAEAKAKEQAAAEIMAGVGDYDRLAAIYGLSDDEVAQMKAAAVASTSGSGKGSGTGKGEETYKDISDAMLATIDKDFARATSIEEIYYLANVKYGAYDHGTIGGMADYYASILEPKEPKPPQDGPDAFEQLQDERKYGKSFSNTMYGFK